MGIQYPPLHIIPAIHVKLEKIRNSTTVRKSRDYCNFLQFIIFVNVKKRIHDVQCQYQNQKMLESATWKLGMDFNRSTSSLVSLRGLPYLPVSSTCWCKIASFFSGSRIRYSFTPYRSCRSFLSIKSRFLVLADNISTTKTTTCQ